MKSPSVSAKAPLFNTNGITGLLLRRGVLRQLAHLKHGQLVVVEDGERQVFGTPGSHLHGEIHILDAAAWGLVASNGSIGAGEAFIHGYWSSPDLTAVVRVFVSNLEVLDSLEGGLAKLGRPLVRGLAIKGNTIYAAGTFNPLSQEVKVASATGSAVGMSALVLPQD